VVPGLSPAAGDYAASVRRRRGRPRRDGGSRCPGRRRGFASARSGADDADEYALYIRDTGCAEYARTAGNRGACMLRRDEGDQTEFVTLSMWESGDAVRAFAGELIANAANPDTAIAPSIFA